MPALSGQKTIATAGTALALGSQVINAPLMIKALDTNTGIAAVGNDGAGDVTVSNGMRLELVGVEKRELVGDLANIMLDVSVNGEGVAWLVLNA